MTVVSILHFLALLSLLAAAVVTDVRERRIPNKVTATGLLVGLVLGIFLEGGFPVSALSGSGLALLVSFPLVAVGALGAGDSKLLTAVGAFVGPAGLFSVALYAALAGGVLAIGNSIRRGAFLGVLFNMKNLLVHWITLGRRGERIALDSPGAESVPYGLAIAAGAVVAWFYPVALGGSL
jgi:prepilin peptidase CpaA